MSTQTKNKKTALTIASTSAERAAAEAHRRSGAAGIHSDQNTRRMGVGRTNRVGSRSSRLRVAINEGR
jgi:hypothetical protein